MGQNSSLLKVDAFSTEEMARLEKRFDKLDLDHSGAISVGEFVQVPELKENPLVKRVVDIFDSDLNGEVDFKGKHDFFQSIIKFAHLLHFLSFDLDFRAGLYLMVLTMLCMCHFFFETNSNIFINI